MFNFNMDPVCGWWCPVDMDSISNVSEILIVSLFKALTEDRDIQKEDPH